VSLNNRERIYAGLFLSVCLALPLTAQSLDVGPELSLGRFMSREFESQAKVSTDRETLALVDRVGQALARHANLEIPLVVRVVDSDDLNTWSLPGGYLYVTTAMIGAASSEAELAAVMAQGIARMAVAPLRPGRAQMFSAMQQAMGGLTPTLHENREHVLEADKVGMQYLHTAGYDSTAAIEMLKKMEVRSQPMKGKQVPGRWDSYLPLTTTNAGVSKALMTHPPIEDRIMKLQKWSASHLPAREESIVTTMEFTRIHEKISR
jgi:predicted Zn-dependent protease